MGVYPRGAHVRHRCGRWLNPLSSTKTIVRPSLRAFFHRGPVLPFPKADLLLVAFPSTSCGPLRAPAQTHQNFPDMPLVVQDPELLLDQVRHAWARPQRSLIAQPLRTFQQPLHQTLAFLVLQQGLAPGAVSSLQRLFPFAPALLRPACNGLASHLHTSCHLGLIQTLA